MKLKLLVAALAAAFSAAAFAQSSTSAAPTTTSPATASSSADTSSGTGTAAPDRTHARKDRHASSTGADRASRRFDEMDTNHDGQISREEWDAHYSKGRMSSSGGASSATKTDKATDHSSSGASAAPASPSSGGPASNQNLPGSEHMGNQPKAQ